MTPHLLATVDLGASLALARRDLAAVGAPWQSCALGVRS